MIYIGLGWPREIVFSRCLAKIYMLEYTNGNTRYKHKSLSILVILLCCYINQQQLSAPFGSSYLKYEGKL